MTKLKTIKLYGEMGTRFGRTHKFAVSNPAEAVQALCSQYPGFEEYMMTAKDRGRAFSVFIGKKNITEKEVTYNTGEEEIRIVPVILGAKSGGWLNIIVGAVFVVAGFLVSTLSYGWAAPVGSAMMKMGVAMMIGGVVQLLMPAPKSSSRDSQDSESSYVFNGPVNTQAQGNPVPILYGRMMVGSAVISAGIKTNQEQVAGSNTKKNTVTGGGFFSDSSSYASEAS